MHRDRPLFVLCAAVGLAGMAENATWGNGERRAIWHRPLARCLWAVVYPANRRPVCLSDELPACPGERHTHRLHAIRDPQNLSLRHSRQCHKVEESADRKRPRQPFCSQISWAKRSHPCLVAEAKGVEGVMWSDWTEWLNGFSQWPCLRFISVMFMLHKRHVYNLQVMMLGLQTCFAKDGKTSKREHFYPNFA